MKGPVNKMDLENQQFEVVFFLLPAYRPPYLRDIRAAKHCGSLLSSRAVQYVFFFNENSEGKSGNHSTNPKIKGDSFRKK